MQQTQHEFRMEMIQKAEICGLNYESFLERVLYLKMQQVKLIEEILNNAEEKCY